MPLNVTVTANEQFADGATVDRAALRRASKPTVSISGQITTADIAASAAIPLTKLENLTEGYIVRGNSSNKAEALQLQTGASLTSGGVLTPSTGTITGTHLVTGSTNAVNGLSTELTTEVDAANDMVMLHDNSDTMLKKVKITRLLNAGISSPTQSVTDLGTKTDFSSNLTIDVSGNPVQEINCTPGSTGLTLTIAVSNQPDSSHARSVMVKIKNTTDVSSGKDLGLNFSGLTFLKNTPSTLARGKTAVLALTAFDDVVIAGYAAQT